MQTPFPVVVSLVAALLCSAPVTLAGEAEILEQTPSSEDGANAYSSIDMDVSDTLDGSFFVAQAGGAPGEDSGAGAVYLELFDQVDDTSPGSPFLNDLVYEVRIPHPEPTANGGFGASLKLRIVGDALGTVELLVSARASADGTSKVYVFEIINTGTGPVVTLKQTLTEGLDPIANYGRKIECAEDSGKLFVSAPRHSPGGNTFAGTVFVYEKQGGTLVKIQEVLRSAPEAGEELGDTLGVSPDGSTMVAGAPGKNVGSSSSAGQIVVFEQSGSSYVETAAVGNGAGTPFERFPKALSNVVQDDIGTVETFYATGSLGDLESFARDSSLNQIIQDSIDELLPPVSNAFGQDIDVSQAADGKTTIVIGDPDPTDGRCYVVGDDGTPELEEVIEQLDDPADLGFAVAIEGNLIAAGAPSDDAAADDAGSASIYSLNGLPFFSESGSGCNATGGPIPKAGFEGGTQPGTTTRFTAEDVTPGKAAFLLVGSDEISLPIKGCEVLVGGPPEIVLGPLFADDEGQIILDFESPEVIDPVQLDCQLLVAEEISLVASSNRATIDFVP